MQPVEGKRVTVAGLGRFGGGVAVARWLVRQGARVLVTDRDGADKLGDSLRQLAGEPIEFRLGEHRVEDFTQTDLVVASPAVPPSSPYLLAATAAKVPVTTEIRLFVERCPARIVGVTGTKG
jgi:UDP-N-acetylmuramoylalanine--D-glutamate ligase